MHIGFAWGMYAPIASKGYRGRRMDFMIVRVALVIMRRGAASMKERNEERSYEVLCENKMMRCYGDELSSIYFRKSPHIVMATPSIYIETSFSIKVS